MRPCRLHNHSEHHHQDHSGNAERAADVHGLAVQIIVPVAASQCIVPPKPDCGGA
jgi:hypothetical protein